jgi:hypothetical protein
VKGRVGSLGGGVRGRVPGLGLAPGAVSGSGFGVGFQGFAVGGQVSWLGLRSGSRVRVQG